MLTGLAKDGLGTKGLWQYLEKKNITGSETMQFLRLTLVVLVLGLAAWRYVRLPGIRLSALEILKLMLLSCGCVNPLWAFCVR